jgi:hypothetical protein
MRRAFPTIEMVDQPMAELLRRKTPAERLASAHRMWQQARQRVIATIRHHHPEWDDEQVKSELRRRTIGAG